MSLTELEFQAETTADASAQVIQGRSPWVLAWRRLRQDKVAVASVVVIVLLALLAILAPVIAAWVGHPPNTPYTNTGLTGTGLPVAAERHVLLRHRRRSAGTCSSGCSTARRISLLVGFASTAIGTVLGVTVGMIAGYFGGWIDTVLARFTDAVLAFPYVVLALALAVVFGPSLSRSSS